MITSLPAIGGPAANEMPINPFRNPIACAAPDGPHMSYAIGPSTTQKQPSARPSPTQNTIKTGQLLVTFRSIVKIPRVKNESLIENGIISGLLTVRKKTIYIFNRIKIWKVSLPINQNLYTCCNRIRFLRTILMSAIGPKHTLASKEQTCMQIRSTFPSTFSCPDSSILSFTNFTC